MKILVLFQDGLGMTGGAPGEIQGLAAEWAKEHDVTFMSRNCIEPLQHAAFKTVGYGKRRGLRSRFREVCADGKPAFMLLIGFFIRDNAHAFALAEEFGIPVVLHPAGHLMHETFRGKIFTVDPNIRSLENAKNEGPRLISRLKVACNPLLKYFFSITMGRRMVRNANLIAVLSRREQAEIEERFGTPGKRFVTLRWGMDFISETVKEQEHYFRERLGFVDDIPNFVYWGRIEWRYKGLDRLLDGVRVARERTRSQMPFRLFLIGPDYRRGTGFVEEFVRRHSLHQVVHLVGTDRYVPGSKRPLFDADVSVCLSRWDGFPRALRESILCGKPLLVSEETHFGDFVAETKTGIALPDADNPDTVADSLLEMACKARRDEFARNALRAAPALSYAAVCGTFVAQIRQKLNLQQ